MVATSLDQLAELVARLSPEDADLVELRLDLLTGSAGSPELVVAAIAAVRGALPDSVPILATFRTPRDGGDQPISDEQYERVTTAAIDSGQVDAIDVELRTSPGTRDRILERARGAAVATVVSHHDFAATPSRDEIVARLRQAQDAGASLVKIAVMPTSPRDVITLLDATEDFVSNHATVPAATMSMGALGAVSRVSGEIFGSAMTFGSVGAASAPGQIDARTLRTLLEALHTD